MPKLDFPSMIVFDYGQTIIDERKYDVKCGISALISAASQNPDNVSADEVYSLYRSVIRDMGFCGVDGLPKTEVPWPSVQKYIFDYFRISFDTDDFELEKLFLENTLDCIAAPQIDDLLDFLNSKCIRTCVASNLSYSRRWLEYIIGKLIPDNNFEFILASSDYIFRKPHPRFFDILAKRARLEPDEIWFCGDSAVCDIDGAAAAGMYPFWYKETAENSPLSKGKTAVPRYDYTPLSSWAEFKNIIERVEFLSLNHML